MDDSRRRFLKQAALASSALGLSPSLLAQGPPGPAPFKRIAVEETFSVPEVLDAMRELVQREPNREPGLEAPPYVQNDTIRYLYDLGEGRLAAMNAARIDKQVLSLWSPGVQVFDPPQGTALARLVNDRLADAVRRHPDRLAGLATIAPQDPAAAAQEVERAVSRLGLNGVLINSHTRGEHLDDPKYWPILEAIQALQTPIYMHPRTPPASMYGAFTDYGMSAALWGYAMEASLHVVRLLMSGLFDRFPRLHIVLGHMGEGLPFWLDRLDQVSARPGMPKLQRRPSDYFRSNFSITTSAMFWDPVLLFCISVLGSDRIMFAVDAPFAPSDAATRWMDAAPVSEVDRRRIYQENAERIFKL
jgi:2,3-dihydroxybenzoate decarboxylase